MMRSAAIIPCALAAMMAATQAQTTVRSTVNPVIYATLPFLLAADKGYFKDEGIDLEVKKNTSSAVTQMPLVARGDLDVTNMVAGPALFNQKKEGFDVVIIASMSETHPGWHDGDWIMVRQDLWDSGAIRRIEDMKGHAVDGATEGSPIDFLMNAALMKAGLTHADVTYSTRLHTGSDMVTAFRNKAVDVLPTIEPIAAEMVEAGLAHRLASDQDITPWIQNTYFVSSQSFVRAHRAAVVGFLKAYLRAAREIVAQGPNWTPDYVDVLTRWSGIPADILRKVPGVPYYGQLGTIDIDSLARQEELWMKLGLVTERVEPTSIVDSSAIDAARSALGIH